MSGNPGGRPKGLERRVRELVDFDAITLMLQDIALGRERGASARTADRIKAAELLFDRGHGKARQAIDLAAEIQSTDGGSRIKLDKLDGAALTLLEQVLEERLAGAVEVGPVGALKP